MGGDKRKANHEQDLLFTKVVNMKHDDVEFIKNMANEVKGEGKFSEGIRACISAARKYYEDDVKWMAARRKLFEALKR